MQKHINTLLLSLSAIIIVIILTQTFQNRHQSDEKIFVTGLGSKDFKSDLIVWSGSFTKRNRELNAAFNSLKKDQEAIMEYLMDKGIRAEEMAFSSISIDKEYQTIYENGKYNGQTFTGYKLTQYIEIESKNVDHVEVVSRDITELINLGIEFYSSHPEYYYTKLSELKIEMVAAATEDARIRAEQIAQEAKSKLGDLKLAQMGVFQIIAQNSSEDYSWGGSFNTTSKMKTATITMRLQFGID